MLTLEQPANLEAVIGQDACTVCGAYWSVIDTLILANMAFLYTALDKNIYALLFFRYISGIFAIIPVLGLFSYVIYRMIFEKPLKKAIRLLKQKLPRLKSKILPVCINRRGDGGAQAGNVEQGNAHHNEINDQLPDCIVWPQFTHTDKQ